jgi:class 3 adenylate cyclase
MTPNVESQSPRENRELEVRQITVLFCDLVGSTELSEKLDPEDLRALIDAYRKVCGAAVTRYDGQVANYAGDGLMAFFGWPRGPGSPLRNHQHPGPSYAEFARGHLLGSGRCRRDWRPWGLDGGGGRDAEYCCAAANARGAQHPACVGVYPKTGFGSF